MSLFDVFLCVLVVACLIVFIVLVNIRFDLKKEREEKIADDKASYDEEAPKDRGDMKKTA